MPGHSLSYEKSGEVCFLWTNVIHRWQNLSTIWSNPIIQDVTWMSYFAFMWRTSIYLCYALMILCAWLRHQMETFSCYWPLVRGIHWSPVNSPHKGQWHGDLMFSLIGAWINAWVNNREAAEFRRHQTHNGVIVLFCVNITTGDDDFPAEVLFIKYVMLRIE